MSSQVSPGMSLKRPMGPENEWEMYIYFDASEQVPQFSTGSEGGLEAPRPTVGEISKAAGQRSPLSSFRY